MKTIICLTLLFAIGSASAADNKACNEPKDVGPCRGALLRYFFDSKTSECKPFFYGGCDGNGNNFKFLLDCMQTCQPETAPKVEDRREEEVIADICSQPKERGPCRAAHPRFFFNKEAGRCEGFLYGGCEGNENNFRTESQCHAACSPAGVVATRSRPEPDFPCDEPKKVGPCRAALPRYYFNATTSTCELFYYGGCFGNGNNFKTMLECRSLCDMKHLVPEEPAVIRSMAPVSNQVCSQPKDQGPCRGAHPRFYFNKEAGQCEEFLYGGCDGNENNFKFLLECMQTCQPETAPQVQDRSAVVVEDVCSQPKDQGPCRGAHPRFYFNKEAGKCEQFLYGGCDGNANNFKFLLECMQTCQPETAPQVQDRSAVVVEDVCSQPKERGPCRGAHPRFFYNQETGHCEPFLFGGCDGNGNNFRTKKECESTCSGPEVIEIPVGDDVCSQGAETGPCFGYFPRYFHNKESGRCEEFIFGGCHGNDNNFRTVEQCDAVCGNQVQPKEEEKKDPAVVCALPSDDGGCRAAFPMYFFNKASNSCEEFIYGGCKGNDNRFHSKQECDQFCKPVVQ